ncbi:hypothetical protein DFH11DRAFT_1596299 [Phellopilus nigrolimitatus]|nr:hypothetical protein DFH11DRAFT_1596299 [Phellopilus nigrolimitatus]
MASNVDMPWEHAATKSVFKVDMSSEPGHPLSTPTAAHQPSAARNMGACARCADMRKKCNMSPPYSSMKCEACDTAKVPCPPHRERRTKKKVIRAQHARLFGRGSKADQPADPSENVVPEAIEPAIDIAAEPLSEDNAVDILPPEVAFMYNVPAPASQTIYGFEGAIYSDDSSEPSNKFAPGTEDWLVQFLGSLTDS